MLVCSLYPATDTSQIALIENSVPWAVDTVLTVSNWKAVLLMSCCVSLPGFETWLLLNSYALLASHLMTPVAPFIK